MMETGTAPVGNECPDPCDWRRTSPIITRSDWVGTSKQAGYVIPVVRDFLVDTPSARINSLGSGFGGELA
jgi:hypothetical protein